jgi:hypothetical protein
MMCCCACPRCLSGKLHLSGVFVFSLLCVEEIFFMENIYRVFIEREGLFPLVIWLRSRLQCCTSQGTVARL